jgi:hypothetical protein
VCCSCVLVWLVRSFVRWVGLVWFGWLGWFGLVCLVRSLGWVGLVNWMVGRSVGCRELLGDIYKARNVPRRFVCSFYSVGRELTSGLRKLHDGKCCTLCLYAIIVSLNEESCRGPAFV